MTNFLHQLDTYYARKKSKITPTYSSTFVEYSFLFYSRALYSSLLDLFQHIPRTFISTTLWHTPAVVMITRTRESPSRPPATFTSAQRFLRRAVQAGLSPSLLRKYSNQVRHSLCTVSRYLPVNPIPARHVSL